DEVAAPPSHIAAGRAQYRVITPCESVLAPEHCRGAEKACASTFVGLRQRRGAPKVRGRENGRTARGAKMKQVKGTIFAAAAFAMALLLGAASSAQADHGQCGQPRSVGKGPNASDALQVLKVAVGNA